MDKSDNPVPLAEKEGCNMKQSGESAGKDDKTMSEAEGAGAGQEGNIATVDLVQAEPEKKKKKKRSKKSKSKRGKNKPTGFEEYYVDAPITPEQYKEEREIYDVTRPLILRIEDAILRYQKNRRLESARWEIFLKYLVYGGVDVGPKMFSGSDARELEQMDTEQIMVTRGQTSISRERSNLEVDFNAVVKGYLTSFFPYYFNPETEDMIKLATVTIKNFLSYLMYHDVCPEYTKNIDEARRSCDIAGEELWKNQQFITKAPGHFNIASSTLFGGSFYDMYVEDDKWTNPKDTDGMRMTNEVARKVIMFSIAGAGTAQQARRFQRLANENNVHAMRIEDIDGFEVTAVVPPIAETRGFYLRHSPDLNPVGRLMGKAFRDPGKPPVDLSPMEQQIWEQEAGGVPDEFEFFVEEDYLKFCYPGMKLITSVWELNCGLHFFDEVLMVYGSNYTVLVNDLMLGWKKPQDIPGDDGSGVGGEDGGENEDEDKVVDESEGGGDEGGGTEGKDKGNGELEGEGEVGEEKGDGEDDGNGDGK